MKHGCIISLFLVLSYADRDRKPSPIQIMKDKKQLENVKYFSYLGRLITKRCTHVKLNPIAMAKTPFTKKSLFTIKFDLKFTEVN